MSDAKPRSGSRRQTYSIKRELIAKSRESALTAVQVFNNPLIQFKSETFIMLMVVAWTYMLHAYYRANDIEYRYFDQGPNRRKFHRTQRGAFKYWELERCLNDSKSPIDKYTANNLQWYWYEKWLKHVRKFCSDNKGRFS